MMDDITILLIDDDKIDRMHYKENLTNNTLFSADVIEADDAESGILLYEKNPVDCVLLDYRLPDGTGFDVIARMKKIDKRLAPIIMLTGIGNEGLAVTAMKQGVSDYLSKDTIDKRILVATISNVIYQSKLKQQIESYQKLQEAKIISDEQYQLKNEFLSNMSHELRTPLTPVIGYIELLYQEQLGNITTEQKEILGIVLKATKHLLAIIDDAICITDFEVGKVELRPEELDIPQAIDEVINDLKADSKPVKITYDVDPTVAKVFIDPQRFKQILLHYLLNAIKFSPDDVSIQIHIREKDSKRFILEVEDNGIGIKKENIKHLFKTFKQLDAGFSKKFQGVGLGLSLVQHIAHALGGEVGVTSSPGQGSIFYAVLPQIQKMTKL